MVAASHGQRRTERVARMLACVLAFLLACLPLAGCERSLIGACGGSAGSSATSQAAFDADDAPGYAGEPAAPVHGDAPFFAEGDFARGAFEEYAELDSLGRCGAAFALVGTETMPTAKRGSISDVRPAGFRLDKYDWVDGGYLYNRCHLIGYQLTGQNANPLNLTCGTRYLNVEGMEPFELQVAAYVRETGNHVLYRVTPVFEGEELVPRGVLMEAASVEDSGAGVRFCRWCYNVQPGVQIDYATGASHADGTMQASGVAVSSEGSLPEVDADEGRVEEPVPEECAYVLNTRSKRFHLPDCPSVADMSERNKRYFDGTRDQAIAEGYAPCGVCKP